MKQIDIDFGPGAVVRLQDNCVVRVSELAVVLDWDGVMNIVFTDEEGVEHDSEVVGDILLPYEELIQYLSRKPQLVYHDQGRCNPSTPAWAKQWLLMNENVLGEGWTFQLDSGKEAGIGWRTLLATGPATL